jgi:hypothetical protein
MWLQNKAAPNETALAPLSRRHDARDERRNVDSFGARPQTECAAARFGWRTPCRRRKPLAQLSLLHGIVIAAIRLRRSFRFGLVGVSACLR